MVSFYKQFKLAMATKLFHTQLWVIMVSCAIQCMWIQDCTAAVPNGADRYNPPVFKTWFTLTKTTLDPDAHWISLIENCGKELARVFYHLNPDFRQFALSFEQLINYYLDIPREYPSDVGKNTVQMLLITIINYNIHSIGILKLEIKRQFEEVGDTRTPDVVCQTRNGVMIIFELKYCRGNTLNKNKIEGMLKNATTKALGYADWYLYGKYQHQYEAPSAIVVVLLVTEYERRVVLQTCHKSRNDPGKLTTVLYWPNSFIRPMM